eukprot:CAMPEP_0174315532 /NCGR_PEP_ID=MMETSP0810-20121108/6346_1 /TAXON_ID=73025 ORGANISM="Eutreptiella gymnastica-like, Strain CCMP1594" /NCGR_SAMPLE_ID=MMETSP0810 /ASSEMBLY_ACC=CAM_ASM_000659 /LENGTH=77 /DNA_ID=CAMNT_0015424943 /DNA_START=187 /DNA_END=420 /DNA_ORIENTATION=-
MTNLGRQDVPATGLPFRQGDGEEGLMPNGLLGFQQTCKTEKSTKDMHSGRTPGLHAQHLTPVPCWDNGLCYHRGDSD